MNLINAIVATGNLKGQNMQIRCENGHYYNSSMDKCPYCIDTILVDIPKDLDSMSSKGNESDIELSCASSSSQDDKTTLLAKNVDKSKVNSNSSHVAELAGWVVILTDKSKAKSYNVTFGFNTIGRGSSNHIVLDFDSSISREKHASIIYDYNNNLFFIKHEDGKYLTYLNDKVIIDTQELKSHDVITIGETKLLFIPLCSDKFQWDR